MEKKTNLNKLFGIDEATLDKSRDIKPILDLGSLPDGSLIKIVFLDVEPKEIDTPNSKYSKVSKVISVKDITLGEENALEYSLFLSAKTLSLGVAKIWDKYQGNLKGKKALIKKTTATFKEFGENVAYNVQEIV